MQPRFSLCGLCIVALVGGLPVPEEVSGAELQPETVQAWERYVRLTEARIAAELADGRRFLVSDFLSDTEARAVRPRLRQDGIYIRKMGMVDEQGRQIPVPDGMIHHWAGSVFIPGVTLRALLAWLQDYDQHERYFQEVERSKLRAREGDTFRIFLRLRRKKVISVYYNTDHTVIYRHHDARRASSRSFTTRIAQLEHPGTPAEKEKPVGNDSGFLWRLNSSWRFQEADGGVYVECESVSLSRAIPFGLDWLIRGFMESVPRESLQNTLYGIRDGIRQKKASGASPSV